MNKLKNRKALIVVLVLVLGTMAALLPLAAATDERGETILANLKVQFPQLEDLQVTMGPLEPSGFVGLDHGSFSMVTPQGNQTQRFLVSSDNTKLYLISGEPIDVSKSQDEIAAVVAEREAAEAEVARGRVAELAKAAEGRPVRGNPSAPITIVEFSDFQCPYCARGAETLEAVLDKHDDVKFVFAHYPLGFHPWAKPAAIAAQCAGEQKADAFWALHDKYFEEQTAITLDNVLAKSREYLDGAGIDMDSWTQCAEDQASEAYQAAAKVVDDDLALGSRHGVSGTPGFFINGRILSGAQPIEAFDALIEQVRAEAR
jgi:protein-disulfide isomerase